MRVHGNLAADSLEAVHVAITWAEACLPDLRRWLGQTDEPAAQVGDGRVAAHRRDARRGMQLWTRDERLAVYVTKPDKVKSGGSLGVAAALSLVCMATGREPRHDVAVTGALDLRGNVLTVCGLEGKLRACREGGLAALLAPEAAVSAALAEGGDVPEDLREYARQALRPYRTMAEAIEGMIKDCPPLPDPGLLSAPRVGVAWGLSYWDLEDNTPSQALVVEVGSGCGRWPGGHVEVAGFGSSTMREHVAAAHTWVLTQREAILAVLGCKRPAVAVEEWGSRDLYVHFAQGSWQGMSLMLYTATVAVAIVSFFTGRVPSSRVAVFGSVTFEDTLFRTGLIMELEEQLVAEQGFRRPVLPCPNALPAEGPSGQGGPGSIRRLLREAGVEVVAAPPQLLTRDLSLVQALPLIFE